MLDWAIAGLLLLSVTPDVYVLVCGWLVTGLLNSLRQCMHVDLDLGAAATHLYVQGKCGWFSGQRKLIKGSMMYIHAHAHHACVRMLCQDALHTGCQYLVEAWEDG